MPITNTIPISYTREYHNTQNRAYKKRYPERIRIGRRKTYWNNPTHYRLYSKKSIAKKRVIVNKLKCKPCADCGIQYNPWVMDFDHLEKKSFAIAQNVARLGINKILKEIEKCEVVCANCHRERTHNRKQN